MSLKAEENKNEVKLFFFHLTECDKEREDQRTTKGIR